jgi:hypothetical protein
VYWIVVDELFPKKKAAFAALFSFGKFSYYLALRRKAAKPAKPRPNKANDAGAGTAEPQVTPLPVTDAPPTTLPSAVPSAVTPGFLTLAQELMPTFVMMMSASLVGLPVKVIEKPLAKLLTTPE